MYTRSLFSIQAHLWLASVGRVTRVVQLDGRSALSKQITPYRGEGKEKRSRTSPTRSATLPIQANYRGQLTLARPDRQYSSTNYVLWAVPLTQPPPWFG